MSVEATKKALEGVKREEAVQFMDIAMRNWGHISPVDADDIQDLAEELTRFSDRRYAPEIDRLQRENAVLADHNGKLEQAIKNMTGNKIGFTYEPTGERVTLYAPNPNAFEIIAKHPEILSVVVSTRKEIERRNALASTGGEHHADK